MLKRVSTFITTAALFILSAVPAYADVDIDATLGKGISTVQKAFVLVLLIAAIYKFFRHALVQAILLVLIGGLVYAALDQSVLTAIGNGILHFIGAK
ncbi:MAG: hypothetical protein ACPLSY_03260 [Moorellaceae bacterium]